MSIDAAFGFSTPQEKALSSIDSTKYPDTNKDFQQNLIRLNQFVDYIASYLQVMQKGMDKNSQDPITQVQGLVGDVVSLFGGGELLYGINLGDLQYLLPAIGALLGFDSTTPFPINLFNAAEHFLLGYVVPLSSFPTVIEGIIDGWAKALGIDPGWINSLNDLLDAIGTLTGSFQDLLSSVEQLFGILGPVGPFGDLWHAVTQLLGGFDLKQIGSLLDPFFKAVAPWIEELAQAVDMLNQIIQAFSGGTTDLQGILNFAQLFTPFTSFMGGGFLNINSWTDIITGAFKPTNLLAMLIPNASGSAGVTGFIPLENLAMDLIGGVIGSAQSVIDAILSTVGFPTGAGTPTDITSYFTDFLSMFGVPALTSPGFNPITAIENLITGMIKPTNLVAMLMPSGSSSAGVTGFIPMENLAMDLIGGVIGTAQSVIDAILSTVGFPTGAGTLTDITQYFNDALSMLGLPPLTSGSFNPVTAVETFITSMMKPTNLLAMLMPSGSSSAGVTGFIPMENLAMDLIGGVIGYAQPIIDAILGTVGFPTGTGTATDINSYFTDFLSMFGVPALTSGTFNPITAVTDFITGMMKPTNLLAMLMPNGNSSAGVTGFIPMENLAMDLIGGIIGYAQPIIDAILSSVGFPTGTGTATDINKYFNDFLSMMGLPALTSGTFDPVTAVKTFINDMMQPTNLLAMLMPSGNQSAGVTGFVPMENIAMDLIGQITGYAQPIIDSFVNTFLGMGGTGFSINDLIRSITSIPGQLITGSLSPSQITHLNIGTVSNFIPEFLVNPNFDTPNSINGQGVWTWDGTQGPPGLTTSVFTDLANNILKELFSNNIAVAANQVLSISGLTKWLNVTGSSIDLTVAKYNGNTLIGNDIIASIASPSGTQNVWQTLSALYTVPSGITDILVRPIAQGTGGRVWFGQLSAKPTATSIFANLIPLLDASKIGSGQFAQNMVTGLEGILGLNQIQDTIQSFVDMVTGSSTHNTSTSGNTLGDLGNALASLLGLTNNTVTIGQNNSTNLANRAISKPTFQSVDPTADSVFDLSSINGSAATFVTVAAANSLIGAIATPDGGIKESIIWLGQTTANITSLILNIYSLNKTTGALTLLFTSPNIISSVPNGLTWNYYNLPTANFITAGQGNWYMVEMQVAGTGTYQVAGMPSHWLPANGNVYPSQMGATRTAPGSTVPAAPATIPTVQYSAHVPWFGLSGAAGVSQVAPDISYINTAGPFSYPIPDWCNNMDIVVLGAGGGGQGCGLLWGEGGHGGSWAMATITRDVQIPRTTTTLTGVVGSPGAGHDGILGDVGSPGAASTISGTGWAGLTAAGGAGGSAGNADITGKGPIPASQMINGYPYYAGGDQSSAFGNGIGPGGGGGGSQITFVNAGPGAAGAVWVRAYQ